jgi:hypothetical protein
MNLNFTASFPEVKIVWSHSFIPSCVFIVWCLIKDRDFSVFKFKIRVRGAQLVEPLCYNPAGRGFIDLVLPAAL